MKVQTKLADASNFNTGRSQKIAYIVLHYTGNSGDTAEGNCRYFAQPQRGASAHYFVDEIGVWQSVKDSDTAWHCGAKKYVHPTCRNANSIGIEMCSRKDENGQYFIKPETVARAVELTGELMDVYGVPIENVVRHYDVTGKNCPAPFVENPEQWEAFKDALRGK